MPSGAFHIGRTTSVRAGRPRQRSRRPGRRRCPASRSGIGVRPAQRRPSAAGSCRPSPSPRRGSRRAPHGTSGRHRRASFRGGAPDRPRRPRVPSGPPIVNPDTFSIGRNGAGRRGTVESSVSPGTRDPMRRAPAEQSADKVLAVDLRSPTFVGRDGDRLPYLEPMGRVWRFFAAWGLDVLVVAAAAASAIGTLLRDDADRPDGLQLWFEVVAITVVLLALCARRRFPFLAPAFVWIGCAGAELRRPPADRHPGRGLPLRHGGRRAARQPSVADSRPGSVWCSCWSAQRVVVYNDPTHGRPTCSSPRRCSPSPGSWGSPCAIGRTERGRGGARAAGRAGAGVGGPGGGGRGAGPDGARAP